MPPRLHPLLAIAKPGFDAVRRLWLPFLLIQLCGFAIVVAYFNSPGVRAFCERLALLKASGGLLFSSITMAIGGGVVPEIFKFVSGVDRTLNAQRLRDLLFNSALFGIAGIFVDTFYTLLAGWFGDNNSPGTVAIKVIADQFGYTPLIGIPWIAVLYTWREHRFHPLPTVRSLGVAWYISRVVTLLFPCWAYWLPMTTLMYSLPASLTFVFGAIANAASATILIAVAERKTVKHEQQDAAPRTPVTTLL